MLYFNCNFGTLILLLAEIGALFLILLFELFEANVAQDSPEDVD